jgi:hypothetical protein
MERVCCFTLFAALISPHLLTKGFIFFDRLFKAAGIKKSDLADPATARMVYAALENEFAHAPQPPAPTTVTPSKLVSETTSRGSAGFDFDDESVSSRGRQRAGVATAPVRPLGPTATTTQATNVTGRGTILPAPSDLPPPPAPPQQHTKVGAATPAPQPTREVAPSVAVRPPAQSVAIGAAIPDAPDMSVTSEDDSFSAFAPPPPPGPVTDFGTVAVAAKRRKLPISFSAASSNQVAHCLIISYDLVTAGIGGMAGGDGGQVSSGGGGMAGDLKSQLAGVKLKYTFIVIV